MFDGNTTGKKIDNYQLLELIGEGGMGEVYLAEQTHPIRRQVAIKIIKLGMDTAEFTDRFESERQALALMDHPYIAKVFDAGATDTGRPYFVMEFVQGVPISDHCNDLNLDIRARLDLFINVCEGIQHAHQKAIIHRDIKPSNVLVTSENGEIWPKIIDFGVAKALDQKLTEHTIQTAMGQILGTPEYMSPEQADMAESRVDTRTDIYLLGELLYILLAGVPPFDPDQLKAMGLHALLYQIGHIDPPRPSLRLAEMDDGIEKIAVDRGTTAAKLIGSIQGDLDWITMRALEKEQDQRYQTSHALIQDIRRYLNDEPVLAGPPSTNYRIRKFVKRNRTRVIAGALVLVALVLGITGTTVGLVKSKMSEARARTEAETAYQVSEFMVGLFEVSDPGEALGNTITAREILDQGVRKIETGLAGQPETQARLMNTMGRVYKELGLYREARPLLEKSLGAMNDLGTEDQPEAAAVMDNLGGLLRLSGNYEEARVVLERALAVREESLGSDHLEVAQSLNSLANLLWQMGDYEQAEEYYNRALSIREKNLGPNHADVAITLNNLGGMRMQAGDYGNARPALERALRIREAALGPIHPEVARSLVNLGRLYWNLGDYDQARPYQERALSIREKVYGPDHPYVALSLKEYANMLDDAGDFEQSRPLYERAMAIQEASLGSDHPNLADTMSDLATSYIDQGEYSQALELIERALAIKEASRGPDHPEVATALNNLATILTNLGDLQVFPYLERALAIQEKAYGPDHLEVAITTYNLGTAYASMYDFPSALPLYRRSLQIREKSLPPDHLLVAESLQGAGAMLMYNFELEPARSLLERAMQIREKALGTDHPDYATSLGDWALLHYYEGKYGQAIPIFEKAVAIQENTLAANHPFLLGNYYNLACLSAATGKNEVALDYLEKAAANGFMNPAIMEDPDLNSLHGNARFQQLAARISG
jgi:serine/threonine protein kinase/tetratricopeptide (TPR) repeat protein